MAICQRYYYSLHSKDQGRVENKVRKIRSGLTDEDYPKDVTIRLPSVRRGKGSVVLPVKLLPDKTTDPKGKTLF